MLKVWYDKMLPVMYFGILVIWITLYLLRKFGIDLQEFALHVVIVMISNLLDSIGSRYD